MIDLILASLVLIVVILIFIIAFLIFYIISEHRKTTIIPWNNEKRLVLPLLTLKSNDRSSGDHCNSATLPSSHKRMTKRLRHRGIPRTLFLRTQNSQGFLLSNGDPSSQSARIASLDQTTIQFDY